MMITRAAFIAVLLLVPTLGRGSAQQDPPGTRRDRLETMLLSRFMDRTATEVGLTAEQRSQVEEIMLAGVRRHRERADAAMTLRRELAQAVEDSATSDAEFQGILERMEAVRRREAEAWLEDQRSIAAVLTPRQRAAFSLRWLHLQDRVRQMIAGRGERRGPPRPPRR